MIVKAGDANGDRPDFTKFRNFDGKIYNVSNSRSSVAIAPGTCIRLFDGGNYTGAESNILCAGSGVASFGLFAFDNRTSSMRVCAANSQAQCARGAAPAPPPVPTPIPTPTPTPTPTPAPAPNGFPKDVTSAPDAARYDDAALYNGGKNCTGGFTAGAKRLQAWLRANYGAATIQGYNCRPNTADTKRTSIHGVGRASDWFRSAKNAKRRAQVASFTARMTANGAAMARAMGVQYWIWNKKQYSVRGTSVLVRSYGGPNPHTDHVHIEINLAGSKLQTSYWRQAGGR